MGRPNYIRVRERKSGRFTGAVPTPRCPKTGKYLKIDQKALTVSKPSYTTKKTK